MTSAPPTSPLPQPPRPGEPADPELRERYRTDASRAREERRAEAVRLAAEPQPSRTPVGPIRVIALLVTIVLVAGAGLSLVGPMLKQSETTEQPLVAASRVDLHSQVGDVRIRAAEPGERPRVVMTSTWGLWKPKNTVRTSDDVTRLDSTCPGPGIGTICEVDWLVVVPPDSAVDVKHGVGQVTLEGTTGDIDLQVGVGDVSISESEAERVTADVGVGAVDYEAVEPPRRVDLSVGVGEVAVRVPDSVRYRVDVSGGSSEVTNTLGSDSSASRRILVESGVGSVRVDPS